MSNPILIPLFLLLLISSGCGVKGNPVPYIDQNPKVPQEKGK